MSTNQPISKNEVAELAFSIASNVFDLKSLAKKSEDHQPIFMAEVCDLTGYSQKTIYGLIRRKEIPFHKVAGRRRIYFSKQEIITWMKKRNQEESYGE